MRGDPVNYTFPQGLSKHESLNKAGHGLHISDDVFRAYSESEKVLSPPAPFPALRWLLQVPTRLGLLMPTLLGPIKIRLGSLSGFLAG